MSEKEVTIGKIVSLEPNRPIHIPERFIEPLQIKGRKYALMISFPGGRLLRLIPTDAKEVIQIVIEYDGTPDCFKELEIMFARYKPKELYLGGGCLVREPLCFYRVYLENEPLAINIPQLKANLSQVKGVYNVNIVVLKVE